MSYRKYMKGGACALLLLLCPAATLAEPETALRAAVQNPVLVQAIQQQNKQYQDATSQELLQLDSRWQAEAGAMKRPVIDALLRNPSSQYLHKLSDTHQVKQMLYVTDQRGLLVAATAMTYHYIMDHNDLWRQAFLANKNQVLSSTVEDAAHILLSQGIRDPKTGDVIGVVSVVTLKPEEIPLNAEIAPPAQHAATTETDPPAERPDS